MDKEVDETPLEAYHNIAEGIIGIAREVTDTAFQQRVWISGLEPGIQSSYEDIIGSLFDDYDVDRVVRHASKYGFSKNQAETLKRFVITFGEFVDQYPGITDLEVLGSGDWLKVQQAASEFLDTVQSEELT